MCSEDTVYVRVNENAVARPAVLAGAWALLCAGQLSAQDSTARNTREQAELECRGMEAKLMQDSVRTDYRDALAQVYRCPDVGPAQLVRRWLAPAPDSARLQDLVEASYSIVDERVLVTTLELAGDQSKSQQLRLAALRVLWYYGDGLKVRFGAPPTGRPDGRAVAGVTIAAKRHALGARPPQGDVRARIADRTIALAAARGESPYMILAFSEIAKHLAGK